MASVGVHHPNLSWALKPWCQEPVECDQRPILRPGAIKIHVALIVCDLLEIFVQIDCKQVIMEDWIYLGREDDLSIQVGIIRIVNGI